MKKTLLVLCVLLTGTAMAEPEVRPRYPCFPITIGQGFLDIIRGPLNAGDNYSDDPAMVPRGFQLKIDSSSEPPPRGAFVKMPNGWPFPGSDSANRKSIPAAFSQLVGDEEFGIVFRLNDIYLTEIDPDFDCDPSAYGGALKEGALTTNLEIKPLDDPRRDQDDELQVTLQFELFDRKWEIDLVDVDLDDRFRIQLALVPGVAGDSIQFQAFFDFTELRNQGIIAELMDEAVTVAAVAALAICGLETACTLVTVATVSAALLALEEPLEDEAERMFRSYLTTEALPPILENTLLSDTERQVKSTILQNIRVDGKTLPDAISSLPIPNFNGLPGFEPEIPPVCQ